ncbi:MAG TPA: UDP-2,4-diacetamido-2,4,6-trideoxy-beta-L-altropyranose hydrolase, partial [Burkholderiales bacterium]|nr:UDP-2,4-diacetamido-2,4,6-trideoxy-beta-L-altropyranose hydrolase [Burkholderiales bacterium]
MASDASIAGNRTLTRVVFRADASETIGTGHVIRCLTLATALRERGVASVFFSREHAGNLCALIEAQGFPVTRLSKGTDSAARPFDVPPHAAWLGVSWQTDAEQTRVAIESMGKTPDWLIVDHYALDANWESAMRPFARRCFAIDDLADRQHDCDLLLDQNLTANLRVRYTGKVPAQCVQLIGPEFALLQPVYAELHGSLAHRAGPVKRLFVYFGGADPHGLSARALEACKSAQLGDVEIDVVVGRAVYDDLRLQSSSDGRIRVHT